jgi:hypothetical protein
MPLDLKQTVLMLSLNNMPAIQEIGNRISNENSNSGRKCNRRKIDCNKLKQKHEAIIP